MAHFAFILAILVSTQVHADGFRCGTRLVVTGDPASRLSKHCGQPDSTYRAKVRLHERGQSRPVSVTQWVYQRRGNKSMIVSVFHGRVVRIERE